MHSIIYSAYRIFDERKKLERAYYKGIVRTIVIYILACSITFMFNKPLRGESLSLKEMVFRILNFSAVEYAWYIEMYIGLFLMIPFLNLLYNNLESWNAKKWLIITCLFLTSLPGILNVYDFSSVNWWLMPSSSDKYVQLIPEWWTTLYPVTIYFIGCYLREYRFKTKCRHVAVCFLLSVGVSGAYNYYRSYGNWYVWGEWQENGSLLSIIPAVFLFLLVLNLPLGQWFGKYKVFIAILSELCLGAYLLSGVVEDYIYPIFIASETISAFQTMYAITLVFAASFVLSCGINLVYVGLKAVYIQWKENILSTKDC